MAVNQNKFLWPEEEKQVNYLIKVHENTFVWTEEEKGKFCGEYFKPIVIPTIKHVPWVLKNILILPGIYDQVIAVIKDKICTGI